MRLGPPRRWMAPSTPLPPASAEFAALTIASVAWSVMSPCTSSITAPGVPGLTTNLVLMRTIQPRYRAPRIRSSTEVHMATEEFETVKVHVKGTFIGGVLEVAAFEVKQDELGRDGWELISAFDTNMVQGASREAIAIFEPTSASGVVASA